MTEGPQDPQQPPQPPVGGAPPPYGQPAPGGSYPPAPPPSAPYGQPTYGQSPYGQAPYGQPGFGQPGGYGEPERPKQRGMAITGLVLALVVCVPLVPLVGAVLGLVVLLKGKGEVDRGRGLAVAALIVGALVTLAQIGFGVLVAVGVSQQRDVRELERGQCVQLNGSDADSETFTSIGIVDCAEPHDAQVVLTTEIAASDAEGWTASRGISLCEELIDPAQVQQDELDDLAILALTDSVDVTAGDTLACTISRPDDRELTGDLLVD